MKNEQNEQTAKSRVRRQSGIIGISMLIGLCVIIASFGYLAITGRGNVRTADANMLTVSQVELVDGRMCSYLLADTTDPTVIKPIARIKAVCGLYNAGHRLILTTEYKR